jgi:hypothetical protein
MMRRRKWLALVGLIFCGFGCKETASVQLASAGGKKNTASTTTPATGVAGSDSSRMAPGSALLEKPVVVESGRFDVKQSGKMVDLPGFQIQLPADWTLQTSVPSPRLANLVTPEGLVVAVFWFGASGGSVDENLKRWEGQFSQLTSREIGKDTLRTPRVTQARWQGTYAGDNGMNPARPNETSVMLVGIVEGAKGSVFFKTVGTIAQTNAARGLLRAAIKDLIARP